MLVFGPTLHHPSTKHQALVKNIKMQHLANLLGKVPKNNFTKFTKTIGQPSSWEKPTIEEDGKIMCMVKCKFHSFVQVSDKFSMPKLDGLQKPK
jgi:hypothetical protein